MLWVAGAYLQPMTESAAYDGSPGQAPTSPALHPPARFTGALSA